MQHEQRESEMTKLIEQITRGKNPAPRRTHITGVAGVGKSTCAAQAPEAIFIPTEDGLRDIDCSSFPVATSYADVLKALSELYKEEHDYRTVAIDSLDQLERLIHAEVCKKHGVQSIELIGYAKGYTFALSWWTDILQGLSALRKDRGMAVILISHSRIERFENPEGDAYDRYVPRLHKLAANLVNEWCDEVLFACHKVLTRSSEAGFNRKRAVGIGTGERILRTTERPFCVAKNRLGMPPEIPLSWNAYAKYIAPNNQPSQEEESNVS
jgi:hypothetical protein